MTDQTAYLNLVLEKLKERIAKLNLSLEEGAKEVEDMPKITGQISGKTGGQNNEIFHRHRESRRH